MIRRPFAVLALALALSCAVFAGTKQASDPKNMPLDANTETPSPTPTPANPEPPQQAPAQQPTATPPAPATVTSASSESPFVTIPLAPPPVQAPAPAAIVATPPAAPIVEPPKVEPPKAETALAPATPAEMSTSVAAPPPKPKPPKAKAKLATPKVSNKAEQVAALEPPSSSLKPPAFRCFVRDVMAFYDRTHVRCYNKVRGRIAFFAVDTSQPIASTVMSKALNGMQMGKPITITFAPGSDLNPSNCDVKNCRRLLDIKN